jgi:hypothetical protein
VGRVADAVDEGTRKVKCDWSLARDVVGSDVLLEDEPNHLISR